MKLTITNLLFVLFFIFLNLKSHAQDIHLAHIHASPTILNPAMTGVFEGDMRFIANTRLQWNAVTKGYKTVVGSMDMKLLAVSRRDFLSGGIQLYADRAGDLNFTTTSVGMSIAYLKSFDRNGKNLLSIGFQSSYLQNSVDYSKVVTFDLIPALAKAPVDQISYLDFSGGVSWFHAPNRHDFYYFGASLFHLNNPQVSFLNSGAPDQANILYRKLTLHGGAHLRLDSDFTIKPGFIFMDQGPHREINMGSFVRYQAKYGKKRKKKPLYYVYLGAWLRYYIEPDIAGVDAIIASLRFDYDSMYMTFSYDINISSYFLASGGRGGPEFSIVKILDWDRKIKRNFKVKCPIL